MKYPYAAFVLCAYPFACLALFVWLLCGGAVEIADWMLADREG